MLLGNGCDPEETPGMCILNVHQEMCKHVDIDHEWKSQAFQQCQKLKSSTVTNMAFSRTRYERLAIGKKLELYKCLEER